MAAEQILRAAILKCLMEPNFASKFDSDDTVETAYPVTAQNSGRSHPGMNKPTVRSRPPFVIRTAGWTGIH